MLHMAPGMALHDQMGMQSTHHAAVELGTPMYTPGAQHMYAKLPRLSPTRLMAVVGAASNPILTQQCMIPKLA